jgi:hemerythrin-like domain-containing protein
MMSHHGFRRDLARFALALEGIRSGDISRVEALREEWPSFRATLHAHHEAEDQGVFPSIAQQHAATRATIAQLSEDHRRIDPLLERGDRAFLQLPETDAALSVINELQRLLEPHLATEELELIPFLRAATVFPPPPNEEATALFAQGFAWCMQGIAPHVIEKVYAMLPENLLAKLPAARAAFDAKCERVWGPLKPGAATTPIPEPV